MQDRLGVELDKLLDEQSQIDVQMSNFKQIM